MFFLQATATPQQQPLSFLIMMAFIFLAMYFVMILPEKKRQKKHKAMLAAIKKNDKVVTIGGIHGVVVNVKEKTFIVRVDDNTKLELDKGSVANVLAETTEK